MKKIKLNIEQKEKILIYIKSIYVEDKKLYGYLYQAINIYNGLIKKEKFGELLKKGIIRESEEQKQEREEKIKSFNY